MYLNLSITTCCLYSPPAQGKEETSSVGPLIPYQVCTAALAAEAGHCSAAAEVGCGVPASSAAPLPMPSHTSSLSPDVYPPSAAKRLRKYSVWLKCNDPFHTLALASWHTWGLPLVFSLSSFCCQCFLPCLIHQGYTGECP